MGISTLQSYRGAQIFEAIGLNHEVIDRYFTWTASRIEGVGLDVIARETALRHTHAFKVDPSLNGELDAGGQYQWRRRGEFHMYNPNTIAKLQHSVRAGNYRAFKDYTRLVDETSRNLATLRGLLKFQADASAGPARGGRAGRRDRQALQDRRDVIRLDQQGSAREPRDRDEPHRRQEQHRRRRRGSRALQARSQRRLAAQRDQAGRLGPLRRDQPLPGQLPTSCRSRWPRAPSPAKAASSPATRSTISSPRFATRSPGVGLISPPPHHDIYSIEDLAQLIHDLKNANDRARISVKLVAEVGVGTIAAGVSKAKADVVLISGHDGGTGASPLTSIKHAGIPWELGLAETQQVLVMNDLRGRIRVETDGQLKTGRDVTIAALLGADEFGFASAALVASGCIMMRVCHLNTCPVGIATQDPELRKKFEGKPEHVVNFMMFIAEEVREHMAQLGFRSMDEMIGHVECLEANEAIDHWKAKGLDLSHILYRPEVPAEFAIHNVATQDHGLDQALDRELIELCADALTERTPVGLANADPQLESRRRHDALGGSLAPLRKPTACRPTRSRFTSKARPAKASAPGSRPASRSISKATPTTISARDSRAGSSRCARRARQPSRPKTTS